MGIILPQFHSKILFDLVQICPEQFIFFRVIIYTKDTDNEFPVSLFQSMHNDIIRDHFIVDINIGKHALLAYFCLAMHIGNFQIAILSNISPAA